MSERTSLSVTVNSDNATLLKTVEEYIDNHFATEYFYEKLTEVHFDLEDSRVGTGLDIAVELDAFRGTFGDFAYRIVEGPAYESLGVLIVHTPGEERFVVDCAEGGDIVLYESQIDHATSLEELHVASRKAEREAYVRYVASLKTGTRKTS